MTTDSSILPAQQTCRLILILCASVYTPSTLAQDADWFVGLKASLGPVTINDTTAGDTIGSGLVIGSTIDGQIEDKNIDDYTAGIGIAVGRSIDNWQVSAEYVWRYRTDWDVVVATPSIQTITNVFSNVETHTLFFNLARQGHLSSKWSWEIGAGIGAVTNIIDADYIEREVPGIRPELSFEDRNQETKLVYNVFAGLRRHVGDSWNWHFRYRYADLGDLSAGPFPQRVAIVEGKQSAHELQIGFERKF